MTVFNPCTNDARVIREAEALAAAEHEVTVFATWAPGLPTIGQARGVRYVRVRNRLMGNPDSTPIEGESGIEIPSAVRRIFFRIARSISHRLLGESLLPILWSVRLFRRPLQEFHPEVIHAHDLDTLLAGWLHARKAVVPLVYDSHELEVGRNGFFLRHEKLIRSALERFLIRKCTAVITVCDSISEYLSGLYGIPRPLVVHNSPAPPKGGGEYADVRNQIGLGPKTPLAVYIGSVTYNRGIEVGVKVLAQLPNLNFALVGPRNPVVEQRLKILANRLFVAERLHFVDPVPPDAVMDFIKSANVSYILIQNVCLSYAMCFPNKLLESLFAKVPVIASNLIEIRKLITEFGGGMIVDEADPDAVARATRRLLEQPENVVPADSNLQTLSIRYGWFAQADRLRALYEELRARPANLQVEPS